MRVSWITSVFGGIDEPKEIPEQTIDFKHYHFSEESNARFLRPFDDRTKALFFKTQMHRVVEADYYIWTDGKIQVLTKDFIEQAINQLGESPLAILKHGARGCIYEEVDFIESEIKKGNKYLTVRYAHRPIREQVESYRKQGYPVNNGLNDCSVFIRNSSITTDSLFNEWWKRCQRGLFDQVSIQFCAWDMGIKIVPLNFKPNSFKLVNHLLVK
jgi:hypothetical protein